MRGMTAPCIKLLVVGIGVVEVAEVDHVDGLEIASIDFAFLFNGLQPCMPIISTNSYRLLSSDILIAFMHLLGFSFTPLEPVCTL